MNNHNHIKDEFTELMHSELDVSKYTDIKHKAGAIWMHLNHLSDDEKKQYCKDYGITWEDALKWKEYWLSL